MGKKENKIKSRLIDIAEDLIGLYAKRRQSPGFCFEKDSFMQIELESSFIYQDTPDQSKATIEIKKDILVVGWHTYAHVLCPGRLQVLLELRN